MYLITKWQFIIHDTIFLTDIFSYNFSLYLFTHPILRVTMMNSCLYPFFTKVCTIRRMLLKWIHLRAALGRVYPRIVITLSHFFYYPRSGCTLSSWNPLHPSTCTLNCSLGSPSFRYIPQFRSTFQFYTNKPPNLKQHQISVLDHKAARLPT